MLKTIFLLLTVCTVLGGTISTVFAECPENKSEVVMTTPNGHERVMCVNDTAIQGIENAVDHSVTNIVTASCPDICWNDEYVSYWTEDPQGKFICFDNGEDRISCNVYNGYTPVYSAGLFTLQYSPSLGCSYSPDGEAISEFQGIMDVHYSACQALLDPYIHAPGTSK